MVMVTSFWFAGTATSCGGNPMRLTVSVIACPVDYAENALLVERLGELEGSL